MIKMNTKENFSFVVFKKILFNKKNFLKRKLSRKNIMCFFVKNKRIATVSSKLIVTLTRKYIKVKRKLA